MKKKLLLIIGLSVALSATALAQGAGKIWYDAGKLYVNVVNRGILVIDNTNAVSPQKLGFISIPGNVDLAVRGNIVLANNFDDLVAIDISQLEKPKILDRVDVVFPHRGNSHGQERIAWEVQSRAFTPEELMARNDFTINSSDMPTVGGGNGGGNMGGSQGGSMSCFAFSGDYLYAVNDEELHLFNIKNPKKLDKLTNKVKVGEDIETVFAKGDKLYIGSQKGMYIYGLDDPTNPEGLGVYEHVRACDPVVVDGKYAYVTMRNGSQCNRAVNQLDVVDISDPRNPRKVQTYRMTNPHGLGKDGNLLFVCDGKAGLKVVDASSPRSLRTIQRFEDIDTYDVIPVSERKLLIMVGSNKISQYDYQDERDVMLLSEIGID